MCFEGIINIRNVLDEINREREFYRLRGLPYPKEMPLENAKIKEEETKEKGAESDYHRFDEQVSHFTGEI